MCRCLVLGAEVQASCGPSGQSWLVLQSGISAGNWYDYGTTMAGGARKCKHFYSTATTDGKQAFRHRTRYVGNDYGAKAIFDHTVNLDGGRHDLLPFGNEFEIPSQLQYVEVMFNTRNCVQAFEIACNRAAIGEANTAVAITSKALEILYASQGYASERCGAGHRGVQTAANTLKSLYIEEGAFLWAGKDPKCVLQNMRFHTWEDDWEDVDGQGRVNPAHGFTMNDCHREYRWQNGKKTLRGKC